MSGPVVLLLLVLVTVPLMLLILRLDAWLTERRYQREQRGDESERYARARAALHRRNQSNPGRTRIGHHSDTEETPHD